MARMQESSDYEAYFGGREICASGTMSAVALLNHLSAVLEFKLLRSNHKTPGNSMVSGGFIWSIQSNLCLFHVVIFVVL